MSDSAPGLPPVPPRRATPWSVRKIVEQVTGESLSNGQGAPGIVPRSTSSARIGLPAFLPGGLGTDGPPTLPLPRPLHPGGEESRAGARASSGEAPEGPRGVPSFPGRRQASQTLELERVYLSYLLLHLDRLAEPALKYLRHAVEQECSERGWEP